VPVEVATVERRDLSRTVQAVASLEATEQALIRPEQPGVVEAIHFEEGEVVTRGTRLFTIEGAAVKGRSRASRAALQEAKAQLANARRQEQRMQELARRRVVAQSVYDEAETQLEVARARVERLQAELQVSRENVRDTVLRAPLTGRISESMVDPGTFVSTGTHLATVYEASPMEAVFRVPERYVGALDTGQPVRVRVEAYPDAVFRGEISFISPAVSERTLDIQVKARLDNESGRLKPGMSGTATVVLEFQEGQPTIPEEALVGTRKGYVVFVIEDGVAHRRDVKTGLREPGVVQITKGLSPGQKVVREGHLRLTDGERVRAVEQVEEQIEQRLPGSGAPTAAEEGEPVSRRPEASSAP
jgi:membrane fusion protein (multidrug efflux system)